MNVHISYKVSKNSSIENEIAQQARKLEKRLQVFRPDLVHLRGVVEENSAREGVVVSLDLKLPSGDLAARERGPSYASVIRAVFDDLIEQLIKHKSQLRSEYKWPRRRRVGRTRPQPQVPFEQTVAAVQPQTVSNADIGEYIDANLPRLTRFVERELRYRENLDELRPGQLSAEEVIGEAISTALGDGSEKPELLALEPWLYRLSIRAIGELARRPEEGGPVVPLEEGGMQPDREAQYEQHSKFRDRNQGIRNQEVIADTRVGTPEASAASEEMINLVELALLSASPADREAFLLFAVEGFTLKEIAAIGGHPVEQVRSSILRAREHLQKSLSAPDEFKDKLLQHSKIA
jgi:RNA polymerase sigma factor (sigma-70 family)